MKSFESKKIEQEKELENKNPQTEEEIKADIYETLKLSPIFQNSTSQEREQAINEHYELYCKNKEKK